MIGTEENELTIHMIITVIQRRLLVNASFAFKGEAIASDLSIEMATIVSMEACALLSS